MLVSRAVGRRRGRESITFTSRFVPRGTRCRVLRGTVALGADGRSSPCGPVRRKHKDATDKMHDNNIECHRFPQTGLIQNEPCKRIPFSARPTLRSRGEVCPQGHEQNESLRKQRPCGPPPKPLNVQSILRRRTTFWRSHLKRRRGGCWAFRRSLTRHKADVR